MKRLLTLLLAGIMTLSALTSCNNGNSGDVNTGDTGTKAPEVTTAAPGGEDEEPVIQPELIVVADAKASANTTGDPKSIFAAEGETTNSVVGAGNTGITHSVTAALSSPTIFTRVVITAPKEGHEGLASATLDASVDGENWTMLKTLGSTITPGKTYTLTINDTTAYSYIRVRQSDEMRTQEFTLRTILFYGVPQEGAAGDLSKVADETEKGTLLVSPMQIATSTESGSTADIFLDNDKSWTSGPAGAGSPNWIISTLTKKTEIRKITVKLWGSNRRPRGAVIQASENGGKWVDLCTIPDLKETIEKEDGTTESVTHETGEWTFHINDTTQYSFIRILQREDLATYNFTLDTVLVYGIESEEAANEMPRKYIDSKTVTVTLHEDYTDPHSKPDEATAADLWDTTNKDSQYTHKEHKELTSRVIYYIAGKMDKATVITKIIYYSPESFANRVRSSYFEASVDGVTWTKIATLPGNGDLYANKAVIELTVDDDTAYNYIRLVQGEGFYLYYWTLGTVEVIGWQDDAAA